MGLKSSRIVNTKQRKSITEALKEKELRYIKDHPDRLRRRSSVSPVVPPIKEERILEDLCDTTNIEPDVPGNNMGRREMQKLIRKISVSDKFTTKFQSEEEFLKHVRRLSDPSSTIKNNTASSSRRSRLVLKKDEFCQYFLKINKM